MVVTRRQDGDSGTSGTRYPNLFVAVTDSKDKIILRGGGGGWNRNNPKILLLTKRTFR